MGTQFTESGNYVLGKGRVLFRRAGEDKYRYIATTPEFNLSVETEVVDLWGADEPVNQKLSTSETQRDYTGSFASHDINMDNLAIFFGGDSLTVAQTGTTISDETITVQQGGTYRLGRTAINPRGWRLVSGVVVTGPTGTPVYEAGSDYEIDLERALITPVVGGDIDDDSVIEVSYDVDAAEIARVVSRGTESARGEILFRANNNQGENKDYIMPNVIIRADGDFEVKGDEYQGLNFTVEINTDENGEAIIVDSPPVAVS